MTIVSTILETAPIQQVKTDLTTSAGDFCPCDFSCDFIERVFASPENDGVSNDFSEFLYRKISPSDTILIELVKNGLTVATINDDTYGTYYNGFAAQPNYIGFVADWTLIFDAFSGGQYVIKASLNILGVDSEIISRTFQLNLFDERLSNDTVKIEAVQNGNIVSSVFDYTDLLEGGWIQYLRIEGSFGEMEPSLDRDKYLDSSYRQTQNRDVINEEYSIKSKPVDASIYTLLTKQHMLGNEIVLTAYNLLQKEVYVKYPVALESFDSQTYDSVGNVVFSIKFSDRQQNNIKRNF